MLYVICLSKDCLFFFAEVYISKRTLTNDRGPHPSKVREALQKANAGDRCNLIQVSGRLAFIHRRSERIYRILHCEWCEYIGHDVYDD